MDVVCNKLNSRFLKSFFLQLFKVCGFNMMLMAMKELLILITLQVNDNYVDHCKLMLIMLITAS